jgi:hypothetical protein
MLATVPTLTVNPSIPPPTTTIVLRAANSSYGLAISAPTVKFQPPRLLRVANAVT